MRKLLIVVGIALSASACNTIPVAQINTSAAQVPGFSPQRVGIASQFSEGFSPAFMLSMERRLAEDLRACGVETQFIHRRISFSGNSQNSETSLTDMAAAWAQDFKPQAILLVRETHVRLSGKLVFSANYDLQLATKGSTKTVTLWRGAATVTPGAKAYDSEDVWGADFGGEIAAKLRQDAVVKTCPPTPARNVP